MMQVYRDKTAEGGGGHLPVLRTLLHWLRRDTSGNVLIITALCLVPLLILIGSAVDISRATMAKSRLQNACDAASLAARRVMRNDTFDDCLLYTSPSPRD